MQAGMVHALQEIYRVLKTDGILIDMRPSVTDNPVEVELPYATIRAGTIDTTRTNPDKHAATQAMSQAVADRLFDLEHEESFDYFTHLDTLDDLHEYGNNLQRSILPDSVIKQVAELIADADGAFSIRVRRSISIARYHKSKC